MAISAINQSRADNIISEIRSSRLPSVLKDDLIEGTTASLAATNGVSPEAKLQACCENQFRIQTTIDRMFVLLFSGKADSWKDVIVSCKWQICIGLAIVACVLILRPELGALIETITTKG